MISSIILLNESACFDKSSKLWEIRHHFSDAAIVCKSETFPVHKIVLAVSSNFFLEVFKVTNEVNLSEFEGDVIKHILEFVYTGRTKIEESNNESKFFELAEKLKIEGLPIREIKSKKRSNSDVDKEPPKRLKKEFTEITDLPPEILIKILSHIPTKQLVRHVGLVSRQMNELSKDSGVGISVTFYQGIKPERVEDIFKNRSHQLHELTLKKGVSKICFRFFSTALTSLLNLKKLDISTDGPLTKEFMAQLFQLKSLRVLRVLGKIEEQSFLAISECKRLKHLRIGYSDISEEEIQAIAGLNSLLTLEAFPCCNNEKAPISIDVYHNVFFNVSLRITTMKDSYLNRIPDYFPKVRTLYVVSSDDRVDTQGKVTALHSLLERCKNLETFSVMSRSNDMNLIRSRFAEQWTIGQSNNTPCTSFNMMKK